jgi:cardiolipin synthase (CMP-forming)
VTRADIPNIISILRITLVWPVVVSLLAGNYEMTLILYTIAGISDGLDGFIAKRYHYTSRLGSIIDPLADKLLLVCTFFTLCWLGLVPLWLVALIIARDALILVGAVAFFYLIGRFEMAPSWISKTNTFFQLALGLIVVVTQVVPVPENLTSILVITVIVTTIASGVHYVWVWGHRAFLIYTRRHGN